MIFRIPWQEFRKFSSPTGIFYLSLVAYFGESVEVPWMLVEETTRLASQITGTLRGQTVVLGESPENVAEGNTSSQDPKPPKAELGSLHEVYAAEFEAGDFIGDDPETRRWRPSLMVKYEHRPHVRSPPHTLPKLQSLTVHIQDKYALKMSPSKLTAWLLEFWNLMDKSGDCVQGLAEVACSDTGGAWAEYDEGGEGPCVWEKRMAHARFIFAEDRLKKMRGVHWGTFIGRSLVGKLDPERSFIQLFNSLPFHGLISTPIGRETLKGGYWLQLNEDILSGEPAACNSEHVGIQNALWLERKLRAKDLLW